MGKTLDRERTSQKIKLQCKMKGVTADRISDELNVSCQTIYGWFSGKKVPTVDHFIELADILGCSVDDLLTKKEFPTGG